MGIGSFMLSAKKITKGCNCALLSKQDTKLLKKETRGLIMVLHQFTTAKYKLLNLPL
jgi:hypothetical protein